jgi:hypothetical protein
MYRTINKNDISNNISIDLSAYVLKTDFDLSLNDISNIKQDKLMFTNPFKKMYQIISVLISPVILFEI